MKATLKQLPQLMKILSQKYIYCATITFSDMKLYKVTIQKVKTFLEDKVVCFDISIKVVLLDHKGFVCVD